MEEKEKFKIAKMIDHKINWEGLEYYFMDYGPDTEGMIEIGIDKEVVNKAVGGYIPSMRIIENKVREIYNELKNKYQEN